MKVVLIGSSFFEEMPAPNGFAYRPLDSEEVDALLDQLGEDPRKEAQK